MTPRPIRRSCPSCQGSCPSGKYLCSDCWWLLPPAARRALSRKDRRAGVRHQELLGLLAEGAPLDSIEISP